MFHSGGKERLSSFFPYQSSVGTVILVFAMFLYPRPTA
jgi:hypothetical protein